LHINASVLYVSSVSGGVFQGSLETFSGLGLMIGPPIGGALFQV